jgi:uncharacterized protein (DUF2252 family)
MVSKNDTPSAPKPDSKFAAAVLDSIRRQNAGRDPERLALKYRKMRDNPFVFLRGACHLFYEALPDAKPLRNAPLAWSCGDLHFENFGSYKGDNRLVYFDINDYDEAALAPATWDLLRLLTSLLCGADTLHATRAEALAVCDSVVTAYQAALAHGKPLWVERDTSTGLVNQLLTSLKERQRSDFLDKRTVRKNSHRILKTDGEKALPATDEQKQRVTAFMDRFAAVSPAPTFYRVLDVARRIAGTGSLGVDRFVILIEGKGSPDGNYLLDLKEAKPSAQMSPLERLNIAQPHWADEAARVVGVQQRMQAVNHAFLQAVTLDGKPYMLRGLQAVEDRVAIGEWGKKLDRLKEVATIMGHVLAWDQLRASGREGSANADALIAFGQQTDWHETLLDLATTMADITQKQWQAFVAAPEGGL